MGLLGVAALARRYHSKPAANSFKKAASLMLPVSTLLLPWSESTQAEVSATVNSYVEASVFSVSSRWNAHQFQQDLAASSQSAALIEQDDNRLGFQIVYGYRWLPNLALEVGLLDSGQTELGVEAEVSDVAVFSDVVKRHAPVSGQGPYAGIRIGVQTENNAEFYVRTGIWSWSAGYALQVGEQSEWITRNSEDWLWGVGFNLPIHKRLRTGGVVQQVNLEGNNVRFIGLNLQYQFDVRLSQ